MKPHPQDKTAVGTAKQELSGGPLLRVGLTLCPLGHSTYTGFSPNHVWGYISLNYKDFSSKIL